MKNQKAQQNDTLPETQVEERIIGPKTPIDLSLLEPIHTPYPYTDSFGSGSGNQMGLGLSFLRDKENQRVVCRTKLDKRFAAYKRLLHGGIVVTMLDEAMGWSVYAAKDILGVTTEISTTFHFPMFVGKTYDVVGWMAAHRDTYAVTKAAIYTAHGRLVAEASGKWAYKSKSRIDFNFRK